MPMSYSNQLRYLVAETTLTQDHFYNFMGTDFEPVLNTTYEYVQEHLDTLGIQYNRKPAKIFYYNPDSDEGPNAYAVLDSWNYLIGINTDLLNFLFENVLFEYEKLEKSQSLVRYRELAETVDSSLEQLLFQSIIVFIFYHEFGHTIQNDSRSLTRRLEYYGRSSRTFNFSDHLVEADADMFAAKMMGELAINFWRGKHAVLKREHREQIEQDLIDVISIIVSAIGLFFISSQGSDTFYTRQETHPHWLVRLLLILDHILGYVNYKLSKNGIDLGLKRLAVPSLDLIKHITEVLKGEKETKEVLDNIQYDTQIASAYAEELLNGVKAMNWSAFKASNLVARKLGPEKEWNI